MSDAFDDLVAANRARVGDPVRLFDGSGREWETEVLVANKHKAELRIIRREDDVLLEGVIEIGLFCLDVRMHPCSPKADDGVGGDLSPCLQAALSRAATPAFPAAG